MVAAIYHRWRVQGSRATAYRRLFALVAFLGLMLGVLYAQRGASVAYSVHATIENVLAPPAGGVQSADGVYNWLQGVLQV